MYNVMFSSFKENVLSNKNCESTITMTFTQCGKIYFEYMIRPEDTIQNMGTHGSITGKTMTRIICFDHITTATTPLPNL